MSANVNSGFACGVCGLLQLDLGRIYISNNVVNPVLGIGIAHTRAHRR